MTCFRARRINPDLWLNSPWWPRGSSWWRLPRRRSAVSPPDNTAPMRRYLRRQTLRDYNLQHPTALVPLARRLYRVRHPSH